jgi:ribulose-5-phosphate 4-epimerase/fuculose-1-phosphate aldolase
MTEIKQEMIQWGKLLFDRRLISGWGGNLSCRVGQEGFLITGQHAPLGFLTPEDLVQIDRNGKPSKSTQRASSETPLHLAVYRGTDAQAVVHVRVLFRSVLKKNTPSARFRLFRRIRRR